MVNAVPNSPMHLKLAALRTELETLVAEGKLGFKSGEGFRKWTPEQQQALRQRVLGHLKQARSKDA